MDKIMCNIFRSPLDVYIFKNASVIYGSKMQYCIVPFSKYLKDEIVHQIFISRYQKGRDAENWLIQINSPRLHFCSFLLSYWQAISSTMLKFPSRFHWSKIFYLKENIVRLRILACFSDLIFIFFYIFTSNASIIKMNVRHKLKMLWSHIFARVLPGYCMAGKFPKGC